MSVENLKQSHELLISTKQTLDPALSKVEDLGLNALNAALKRSDKIHALKNNHNRAQPDEERIAYLLSPEAASALRTKFIGDLIDLQSIRGKDAIAANLNHERVNQESSAPAMQIGKLITQARFEIEERKHSLAMPDFMTIPSPLRSRIGILNPDLDHERHNQILAPVQNYLARTRLATEKTLSLPKIRAELN